MSYTSDTHWMLEGAEAPTREARARAIVHNLTLWPDDEESGIVDTWLEAPDRYAFLLGMTGTGDEGVYRVVPRIDRQAVIDYFDQVLDLSEWLPHTVLDLDTGDEVPIYLGLSFAPIAPVTGEEQEAKLGNSPTGEVVA